MPQLAVAIPVDNDPGLRREAPSSQSWGFISLEVWVVAAEKEALQTLCISKNLAGDALALYFEGIDKPVHRTSQTPVNQRINFVSSA
jgi:hypothetical protein